MAEQVKSLDEIIGEKYKPYTTPLDTPFICVETGTEEPITKPENISLSLDGQWIAAPDGFTEDRLDPDKPWEDGFIGNVPNSIHTMLFEAGKIGDPVFAGNDKKARESSYRTWWMKKEFTAEEMPTDPVLHFEGIAYRAQIWLNGKYLGFHSGMFGGPDYYVGGILREKNTLIVKIFNAPYNPYVYSEYADTDEGWKFGTVINCVYGWHYACIPSRGIWKSVHIDSTPKTTVEKPFFVPMDTDGTVDLILRMNGAPAKGTVRAAIRPKNFAGDGFGLLIPFEKTAEGKQDLRFRFRVPDPKLWWPNGYGDPNVYETETLFAPENDLASYDRSSFGIRTVQMGPLPGGPRPNEVNLTYIINGKKIFIKGTNWCTTDVLLRFPHERYERFLSMLKAQHVMLLRAWGGGMPETDDFYDTCDALGIMVRQEWPTCWDSDRTQPEWELADTVVRNMIRIRNHPSLVTVAGGNESHYADSPAMTRMARCTFENDGSRVFHKSSPFGGNEEPSGGIIHDYSTYWGKQEIDSSLRLAAPFIGEFGMASAPNLRSVQRYLPDDEKEMWPPKEKGSFYYHMPRFNECCGAIDMDHIGRRVSEFSKAETMKDWIDATQLAQATVIRHVLEKMRTRWPASVGVCYYKATDVYPACSWSTLDYYGVPKLSYYVIQDAYAPLHAAIVFPSITLHAGDVLPVWVLNDKGEPFTKGESVRIRFYDGDLTRIGEYGFDAVMDTEYTGHVGDITVNADAAAATPLLITAEVTDGEGKTLDRTFYWMNFKDRSGCLYELPKARVTAAAGNGTVTLRNESYVPAVGVTVECSEEDSTFTVSDSFLWLEPGETVTLTVNTEEELTIGGMNLQ